ITAWIAAAPLHQVLAAISRLTGIEVQLAAGPGERLVSAALPDLDVAEGGERILQGSKFALAYRASAAGNQLARVWVVDDEDTGALLTPDAPDAPSPVSGAMLEAPLAETALAAEPPANAAAPSPYPNVQQLDVLPTESLSALAFGDPDPRMRAQ